MRVAALYDIHGNLPALEAVLAELREARRRSRLSSAVTFYLDQCRVDVSICSTGST